MNKRRLLRLAEALRVGIPGVRFDMQRVLSEDRDGVVLANIAGCAVMLEGHKPRLIASDQARVWLDLDDKTAWDLFNPRAVGKRNECTAREAAGVVENLATTGVVDWTNVQ
jgi:hypothetical protein